MTGLLNAYFPGEDMMNPAQLMPGGLLGAMGPSVASRMQAHGAAQRARMAQGDYSPTPMTGENIALVDDVAGGLLGSMGLAGMITGGKPGRGVFFYSQGKMLPPDQFRAAEIVNGLNRRNINPTDPNDAAWLADEVNMLQGRGEDVTMEQILDLWRGGPVERRDSSGALFDPQSPLRGR